jgi:hypothetical protein
MATMRSSGDILANIATDLADNNAGLISAADVRNNMEDTVFSINRIIASGDTNLQYPFFNDVRAKHDETEGTGGTFFAESGIIFPNSPVSTERQIEPFLGIGNLQHDNLAGLADGDPHTQYVPISGVKSGRVMTGNLGIGNNWIGASGNSHIGFKFAPNGFDGEDILTSGDLVFADNSRISTGFSSAKAWLNFDASGVGTSEPVIRSWHNVSGITKNEIGKFTITFNSGVFANNNYVAFGTSNGTTTSSSKEDMSVNTVSCVIRTGNDDNDGLRTCTFVIQNKGEEYVDGKINDFVAYGYEPTAISGTAPTVVGYGG